MTLIVITDTTAYIDTRITRIYPRPIKVNGKLTDRIYYNTPKYHLFDKPQVIIGEYASNILLSSGDSGLLTKLDLKQEKGVSVYDQLPRVDYMSGSAKVEIVDRGTLVAITPDNDVIEIQVGDKGPRYTKVEETDNTPRLRAYGSGAPAYRLFDKLYKLSVLELFALVAHADPGVGGDIHAYDIATQQVSTHQLPPIEAVFRKLHKRNVR